MKNGLWILLALVLFIYGPVELTRVILDWEGFSLKFILEIGFMWLFYGLGVFVVFLISRRRMRRRGEEG